MSSPAPGSRATPFGAVIPLPPAPPPGSPAGAGAQHALLQRLVASNNQMAINFNAALTEQTDAWALRHNQGLGDVRLQTAVLTQRELHKQSAYELSPAAFVPDWRRGAEAAPAGLLSQPATKASLRSILFDCKMRKEDKHTTELRSAKPTVWSNAPKLGAGDIAVLGSAASQDQALREQQESHLKQVAPLLQAVHTGGELLSTIGDVPDALKGFKQRSCVEPLGNYKLCN